MKTKALQRVASELNLSYDEVENIYRLYWQFIKETITELPLKDDLTEEEFNKLKKCFYLTHLGYFGCNYRKYARQKRKAAYVKHGRVKAEVGKTDV